MNFAREVEPSIGFLSLELCDQHRGTISSIGQLMDPLAKVQRLCADFENREVGQAEFLEQCVRLVAASIGCSRAGVWLFLREESARCMHCLAMYDATRDCMTQVPDEEGPSVAEYFLALEQTGHVIAPDAEAHFATASFFKKWLQGNNVKSLLAAAFSVNGRLYGAFTCTQVSVRKEWNLRQLSALRTIGARVSLALANTDSAQRMPDPLYSLVSR